MVAHKDIQETVYLDYAATSPLYPESATAMAPFMKGGPANILVNANPNSLYQAGRYAYSELEDSRRRIATCLGAKRSDEIIFTSGATEADNAALFGIATAAAARKHHDLGSARPPHIITTAIEHDAVLSPCKTLEHNGFDVTYLKPGRNGIVSIDKLSDAIKPETVLVSVQMANSEVGAIQPIARMCDIAHEADVLFHTDAVQALGKMEIDLANLGVDAASFSAHKIGGPRGIGALYLKARTPFSAQVLGGGQERGLRSGTQNTCGAVGFAAAMEVATSMVRTESVRLQHLRDKLYRILTAHDNITATVDVENEGVPYLPNIVNVLFKGIESETLVLRFDALGFSVSGGSACSSHSLDPSHVLVSMGISADDAYCALRISMGRYTTEEQIDAFSKAVCDVIDWKGGR